MKPIPGKLHRAGKKAEEATLICLYYKNWPPAPARMRGKLEGLRASQEITEALYQQTLVWKKQCGLLAMNEETCLECPHVRKIVRREMEYYADHLDGSPGGKLTDWRKAGAGAKYRRKPPKAVAARVRNRKEEPGGNA